MNITRSAACIDATNPDRCTPVSVGAQRVEPNNPRIIEWSACGCRNRDSSSWTGNGLQQKSLDLVTPAPAQPLQLADALDTLGSSMASRHCDPEPDPGYPDRQIPLQIAKKLLRLHPP
jgi:hypothetical protein